jgi:hypothetical protein
MALSDCEILARITGSGWSRRLWTLQEDALAQSLVFRFADSLSTPIKPFCASIVRKMLCLIFENVNREENS